MPRALASQIQKTQKIKKKKKKEAVCIYGTFSPYFKAARLSSHSARRQGQMAARSREQRCKTHGNPAHAVLRRSACRRRRAWRFRSGRPMPPSASSTVRSRRLSDQIVGESARHMINEGSRAQWQAEALTEVLVVSPSSWMKNPVCVCKLWQLPLDRTKPLRRNAHLVRRPTSSSPQITLQVL